MSEKGNDERKESKGREAAAEGEQVEELAVPGTERTPGPEEWEEVLHLRPKVDLDKDLGVEQRYQTQRSDGSTFNPDEAHEQGLTYTPPSDPPVVPSPDEPQGAEIAAGFAPSMEDTEPGVRDLPERIEDRDLTVEQKIHDLLRYNSETRHLRNVRVYVSDGVAFLFGSVPGEDDPGRVASIVGDLPEVSRVEEYLEVTPR